jgi:hypothetical protein
MNDASLLSTMDSGNFIELGDDSDEEPGDGGD